MVNDEVGFVVRAFDNGMVAGADDFAGNRSKNSGTALITDVRVGTKNIAGDGVIDSIAFTLVAATAVGAERPLPGVLQRRVLRECASQKLSHTWYGLPGSAAILNARAGPFWSPRRGGSCLPIYHTHQSRTGADLCREIQKIASVEEIPLTIVISKRVSIDGKRAIIGSGEDWPGVFIRPGRFLTDGDMQLVIQTLSGKDK